MKNIFDKTNTENSTLHRPGKLYADLVALLMLVLLIISLIPLLHLGLYNHPTGDDYYYGVEAMHTWQNTHNPFLVIIEAAKGVPEQYRIWQGTYSALFLMYLPPNIWGPNAYHLVTPLILALLVSGIFFLAHELLRRHRLRRAFDDGIRVDAKILGLVPETRVTVNHVHPWVLECAYTDTSGVVHIYRSRYLYTDVSEFLTSDTVPVYIDRVNEKTAFVDVDAVLPEIRKHY